MSTQGKCSGGHFFVVREARETPSCLGSHRVRCLHCGHNKVNFVCDMDYKLAKGEKIRFLSKNEGELTPDGRGGLEPHVHSWDEIIEKRGDGYVTTQPKRHFKCVAAVTDRVEGSVRHYKSCGREIWIEIN